MEIDKLKTGLRLKKFLLMHFDDLQAAAKFLDTTTGSLRNSYFNGRSLPGGELIAKLQKKGCDINWLFYGRQAGDKAIDPPKLEFRLEEKVPPVKPEIVDLADWWQSEVIDHKPEDHVFLQTDNANCASMAPLLSPGDLALISFSQKPQDGDIVAARWEENKGEFKVFNNNQGNPGQIILTAYNQSVPPLFLKRQQVKVYKVVLIKKK
ncbi:MAG: S24 family peptidase [Ignavibacteriales bacterium]|nr:S24 family peptidase [Ignavibacteriales bacterium]